MEPGRPRPGDPSAALRMTDSESSCFPRNCHADPDVRRDEASLPETKGGFRAHHAGSVAG
jgi:hypothetical protein